MASAATAIIAVGSELLTGDTANTNATWLSQQIRSLGHRVLWHLTVDDNEEQIQKALRLCQDEGMAEVFVTGGLGPTTDDITRDSVAKFLDRPLQFSEQSWHKIVELLNSRGVPIADTNKRQCYFPQGSEILTNPVGTADGFLCQKASTRYWILPGPPKEMHSLWQAFSGGRISQADDPVLCRIWHTIGYSESALGQLLESLALEGLDLAYQSHAPYVRVKAFYRQSDEPALAPKLDILHDTLQQRTFFYDTQDPLALLWSRLDGKKSQIWEGFCRGYVTNRLIQVGGGKLPHGLILVENDLPQATTDEDFLAISKDCDFAFAVTAIDFERDCWSVRTKSSGKITHWQLNSPYDFKTPKERLPLVITEVSIAKILGATS